MRKHTPAALFQVNTLVDPLRAPAVEHRHPPPFGDAPGAILFPASPAGAILLRGRTDSTGVLLLGEGLQV